MFDLTALEGAGFNKTLTTEEWEQLQGQVAARYARAGTGSVEAQVAGGNVVVDYVLERGNIRVSTEQNTQDQAPFGISMTVHYPQVAVIENVDDGRRVSCDAGDTALILLLADEIATPIRSSGDAPRPDVSAASRPAR